MADVRVRSKATGIIHEMSEYSYNMLRNEYTLVGLEPGKRPIIIDETPKEEKKETIQEKPVLDRKQLVKKYTEVFGVAPHGRMKEETILEKIKAESKFMVAPVTGE